MKGLELSRRYYLEYGEPMLKDLFPELLPLIAVGLAGSGSECLGFDDDISRDHDFEPGFCIFLPDESIVDRKTEFALERAYSRLPEEYLGARRSLLAPVGGKRHGVMRMGDFFEARTGKRDGELSIDDWLVLPEQALLEATGGEVFHDGLGEFTAIRKKLGYLPEDIRLKKLAGHMLIMAQSGQYNYERCISRGETAAAQLALFEFVKSAIHVVFLLNKQYIPYYKWSFKALRELQRLSALHDPLEQIISLGNDKSDADHKITLIDNINGKIISELSLQGLTEHKGNELEGHAYSINSLVSDPNVRNMHILCAI